MRDAAMTELPISVCRVDSPDGPTDYVTCLSGEYVFEHGLVSEAIVGVLQRPLEANEPITPDNFARNRTFVDFMHGVIARHAPHQKGAIDEAARQLDGWVYIIDQRTPTPDDAVPPEDVIGGFEVRGGGIVADSYQSNPNHVLLSSRGFFRLGVELQQCLLDELMALV